MSKSIDNRVVQMQFDNKQFEAGVSTSMSSLDKLKASLAFKGNAKGLEDVQAAVNKFSTDHAQNQVNAFSKSFIALTTVGVTAISNLTNRVVDAGIRMAKSLSIQPITDGFGEYELKMKSIQTILANTARYGTSLEQVTAELDKLNEYSDQTIYNFAEMTKNASLFTNSGMKIEDATAVIKGFSNEAAASGTGAQEAAAAAYQLSQAFNSGIIRLMDFRSLTNVGMGNKNMQSGLIEIAKSMGKFTDETTTAEAATKNFNASLESEWLTSDVMMNYLKIQAGELTAEQMKSLGLTDQQITAFQKQAATALDAATKVRTLTQFMSTTKEAIASGWSETFTILIGDFNEATNLFGMVGGAIAPMIKSFSDSRNNLLKEAVKMGARDDIIAGFKQIFSAVRSVTMAIYDGFRDVFPKKTAADLAAFAKRFLEFTTKIQDFIGDSEALGEWAETFFRALKTGMDFVKTLGLILWQAFGPILPTLKDLAVTIFGLFDSLNTTSDGASRIQTILYGLAAAFQAFVAPLAKYLNYVLKLINLLLQGDMGAVKGFLSLIGQELERDLENLKKKLGKLGNIMADALENVANVFRQIGGPIFDGLAAGIDRVAGLFGGFKETVQSFEINDNLSLGWFSQVQKGFQGVKGKATETKKVWEYVVDFFYGLFDVLATAIGKLMGLVGALVDSFTKWLSEADFAEFVDLVRTILVGGILYEIKTFVDGVGDVVSSASKAFDTLTGTLKNMQRNVQANIILKIGIAVALLAASLLTLGLMDPADLAQGMGAVVGILGALIATMAAMNKIGFKPGQGVIGAATALVIMATAIRILAGAVKSLGAQPNDVLIRGGVALAALLTMVTGFMTAMNKFDVGLSVLTATALLIMSGAIAAIAATAVLLGLVDPVQMAKGLGVLLALVGIMTLMSAALLIAGPIAILSAAALVLMTAALAGMAAVAVVLGAVPTDKLVKGLAALTGLLLVMTLALTALGATGPMALVGAVAILATAKALAIMTAALVALSLLSNGDIFKGLATLMALTGIIALLGVTATVFAVPLLGLAAALLLFGVAVLAAGAGVWLLSAGLVALGASGAAAFEVIKAAILEFVTMMPDIATALANSLIQFLLTLANGATDIYKAVSTLIGVILQAFIDNIPLLGEALKLFILTGLEVIRTLVPDFIETAIVVLMAFLSGIEDNLDDIIDKGTDIVVALIKGIGNAALEIIIAAGETLMTFLRGLQDWIEANDDEFIDVGYDLADAIIVGILKGLVAGPKRIWDKAWSLGETIVNGVKGALDSSSPSKEMIKIGGYVIDGLVKGISNSVKVEQASTSVGNDIVSAFTSTLSQVQDAVTADMDMSPVITPVINLDQYRKDAKAMIGLTPDVQFDAAISYKAASDLARQPAPSVTTPSIIEEKHYNFNYEQHNTSPESLSTTEIYRQTNNQLSVVKRTLATV